LCFNTTNGISLCCAKTAKRTTFIGSHEDDYENGPELLTVDQLTDEEWAHIRRIAIETLKEGAFGTDQMKCAIAAFVEWLGMQEGEISIQVGPGDTIH